MTGLTCSSARSRSTCSALLTLGFIVWLMVWDKDIFAMKEYQKKLGAKSDSLNTETHVVGGMGKVKDLIVPILFLIVSCIAAMMYTGGILESGNDCWMRCKLRFVGVLVLGSFFTLVFTFIMYVPRRYFEFWPVRASPLQRALRRWYRRL